MLDEKIKQNAIAVMQHAIGMGHKRPYKRHGKLYYKPYRNYFATGAKDSLWEEIRKEGYATMREESFHIYYFLTRSGLDWLGKQIGVHIYDESD